MGAQLYNTKILRLAATIPHQIRLMNAQASVVKVSPICGSKVIMDMDLSEEGRVARFGQEVRACALGQAAASLVGSSVLGRSPEELADLADTMRNFLAGTPVDWEIYADGLWAELALFAPAIPHRSRHGSIMLAFDAATEAAQQAAQNEPSKAHS